MFLVFKIFQNWFQKNFNYFKCIPYFKKGRNLLSYFLSKIKGFKKNTSTGVYRIPCDDCSQCYIRETKLALTLRIKEHQANCRNQNQHSAVVDQWSFSYRRDNDTTDKIKNSYNGSVAVGDSNSSNSLL